MSTTEHNAFTQPDHAPQFDLGAEATADAMMRLICEMDAWRTDIETECSAEDVDTVLRAVEAVLARARAEAGE
jgi:hypothetical protein